MSNFVSYENMQSLFTGVSSKLDEKVEKVAGKGLSTEDYTTDEKTKLGGIAADADVNVIESISVNGTPVAPDANKNVALTVMTNTVNDLVNYYKKTETYTQSEVDALIAAIVTLNIQAVNELPTTDISRTTIYLVPKADAATQNAKDEYINLDGTTAGWEKIGDTEIDLSDYVTDTELNTALADYTTTEALNTLLGGYVAKSATAGLLKNDGTVDTNTYLTEHQDISGKADKVTGGTNGDIATLDANGNIADSGIAASNLVTKSATSGLLKNDGTVDTNTYLTTVNSLTTEEVNALLGLLD